MRIFKERSEWFDIPEDKDKGRIKLKYLNQGEQHRLVASCVTRDFVVNEKTNISESKSSPDEIRLIETAVDVRIIDWENIIDDVTGQKLECNKKNKIRLNDLKGFSDILKDMIDKLNKMVESEREQEEKNLPDSLGGSPE